ncbi:MAG: hypothetical protein HY887_01295 [Deltaproteobacteria bacterium]|nr:hypothetical protein [Deltaproteobacteria bacterium]
MEESVSIVIPVYEEEESLRPLYKSIKEVMDGIKRPYEILVRVQICNLNPFIRIRWGVRFTNEQVVQVANLNPQ